MSINISKLIENILNECATDPRIETGIFDIHNYDHADIMAEHMAAAGIDKKIIMETMNELVMDEGKYPERQAFNREGWLVTFPSKEYRDAAIKKGTHAISDPTHGKGGMNLYYKKRGKQKRQTQQAASATEPVQPTTEAPPTPSKSVKPANQNKSPEAPEAPAPENGGGDNVAPEIDPDIHGDSHKTDAEISASLKAVSAHRRNKLAGKQSTGSALPPAGKDEQPTTAVAPVSQAASPLPDYTKKFALEKGWKQTPYGDWRDTQGNTVAVTGISGEVVPTQSVLRDELKLYVEKNAQKPAA